MIELGRSAPAVVQATNLPQGTQGKLSFFFILFNCCAT